MNCFTALQLGNAVVLICAAIVLGLTGCAPHRDTNWADMASVVGKKIDSPTGAKP